MNLIDSATEPYRLQIEHLYNASISYLFENDLHKADLYFNIFSTIGLYWIVGFFYTMIDIFERPKWLFRYKIQIDKSQVNKLSLFKLIRQVLFNQFISFLVAYLFYKYQLNHPDFIKANTRLPTLTRFILEWTMFILIREFMFYYSHRLLHHRLIYKYIHKQHHEWQTPIAIAAMYCHPLEHVISNILPVMVGPILMNSHKLVIFLWIAYAIVLTLNDHCGYHFPLTFSPLFHDFHHLKFNVNYGILGLLDRLHGTDKLFRQSKFFKNHRMYFSLSPQGKVVID